VNLHRTRVPIAAAGGVLVILFGLVGVAYTVHLGPWAGSEEPGYGPVIARVDDRPIYLAFARARVAGLASVHGSLSKTMGSDWYDKILDSLVDDQILEEQAARLGIAVSTEELSVHVANLRAQFPSADAFDKWLASQGMDLPELERRITLQTIGARVYDAVTKDVTVSDEQIRRYYDSHPSKYQQGDGTPTPLFDVKDQIRLKLLGDARDGAFATWLQATRSHATVVVVDPNWWKGLS
jgi:SurA-like protein